MGSASFQPVTPHIFKLDLPLFGGAMRVGVWLVQDDTGWTMIDAGTPRDVETIVRATLALTRGQPPTRIILTHGHYDHAGSVSTLQDRWSMSVLTHPIEAPYVTGQATYGSVRPIWWGNWLLHSAAGRHSQARPARVTDTLREGDEVAGLSVRHVPGHAPGMIALVHPVDRAIIAGDTFVSRDGRLAPPARIFTADLAEARRSMRKLAGEDFEHMLASHGQPILGSGKIEAERAAG